LRLKAAGTRKKKRCYNSRSNNRMSLTVAGLLAPVLTETNVEKVLADCTYMTFINYAAREINCKIVYYGPGLSGKVENLQWIYDHTPLSAKGKLTSLPTETDRTLFFDFMQLELGNVRGFKTHFHLYTVPGQVFYNPSRKLILKGVDGVVFVADSQVERMDANIESLHNLEQNLKSQGYDLMTIPYVLQLNKRDLPNIMSVEEMKKQLMVKGEPVVEAVASAGIGVFETLKAVAKLVLTELTRPSEAVSAPTAGACEPRGLLRASIHGNLLLPARVPQEFVPGSRVSSPSLVCGALRCPVLVRDRRHAVNNEYYLRQPHEREPCVCNGGVSSRSIARVGRHDSSVLDLRGSRHPNGPLDPPPKPAATGRSGGSQVHPQDSNAWVDRAEIGAEA
jgi:hypothetical protein